MDGHEFHMNPDEVGEMLCWGPLALLLAVIAIGVTVGVVFELAGVP